MLVDLTPDPWETRAFLQQWMEAREEQKYGFSNGSGFLSAGKYPGLFQLAIVSFAHFAAVIMHSGIPTNDGRSAGQGGQWQCASLFSGTAP